MEPKELQLKMLHWLEKNQVPVELILLFFACIGLAMNLKSITPGTAIFGVSLTTISVLYFLIAFNPPVSDRLMDSVAKKVLGIGSSVTVLGIMFHFLDLPGSPSQLLVGTISMGTATVVLLVSEMTGVGTMDRAQYIRTVLIIVVAVYLLVNPTIIL